MSRSRKGAGPLGFEDTLWKTADKLKGSMDASEYKHVVLGVVFLQPRSTDCPELTRPRIRGKCLFFSPARNAVGVPPGEARQPEIGKFIDTAMNAVEIENSSLRGVLPKNFARPGLDVRRLGEMVHLIAGLGLGAAKHRQKDLGSGVQVLLWPVPTGRGQGRRQVLYPRSVVPLRVDMIEPHKGRVYDPCCGSGGMFAQSERFVEVHGGGRSDIAVYGGESNDTTWRLPKMNLAIRGIEANLGPKWGHLPRRLAPGPEGRSHSRNLRFNVSHWGGHAHVGRG